MKKSASKPLVLSIETLRNVTGGIGGTFGPLTVTLRTATVATRTIGGTGDKDTKMEA